MKDKIEENIQINSKNNSEPARENMNEYKNTGISN